jgi:hypothetical protein
LRRLTEDARRAELYEENERNEKRRCRVEEQTTEQLLRKYAKKPVRKFIQIDGWVQEYDRRNVLNGDGDGHVLMTGETYELRNTADPLRVQIPEGADKETVLALLAKAYRLLADDWELISTPSRDLYDPYDEWPF